MEDCRSVRVALADELDRLPCRARPRVSRRRFGWRVGCPGAQLGEVEPGELGRVRHRVPECERPLEVRERLGEAEDGLRFPCRLDRRGQRVRAATRRRPVRGELSGRRSSAARELLGQLRVQLLALTGQDRRVDRLRQERVAEAEAAGRLVGDEDAVLDCPAQRLAYVTFRERRDRAEQRVRDVSSGGRRCRRRPCVRRSSLATRCSRRSRRPRGSPPLGRRRRREAPRRKRGCPRRGRRSRSSASPEGVVGTSRKQRRQLVAFQRPEARAGPPSPNAGRVRKAAHALRGRQLVRAVGREQQNLPVVEVVREEDEEIERRRIGPVQVLEHEQHRRGGCPVGEQRERVLEHPQLRAGPPPDLPEARPSGRSASTNGWYGSSVPTRSIDRPSRTSNPASRARLASSDASRLLPMPASPATRTVAPLPARVASTARSSSASSRTRPTNTSLARAPIRPVSRSRHRSSEGGVSTDHRRYASPSGGR